MTIIDQSLNKRDNKSVVNPGRIESLANKENLSNKLGIYIPVYHLTDKRKEYRVKLDCL